MELGLEPGFTNGAPLKFIAARTAFESPLLNALESSPIFHSASPGELAALCSVAELKTYMRREPIFEQGLNTSLVYFVLRGVVEVRREEMETRRMIFALLRGYDVFGESTMQSVPTNQGHYALTDCVVASFPAAAVRSLLLSNADVSYQFSVEMARRVRSSYDRMRFLGWHELRSRVAFLLLELIELFGTQISSGWRIELKLTNREIGDMVCSTRESVNRLLNTLWDEKVINLSGALIVVERVKELEQMIG